MKTPTLIVRLLGLYLLTTCSIGLIEFQKVHTMMPSVQMDQVPVFGSFRVYAWLGLIVGILATAFAGPLAQMLTFDSEPREKRSKLSDDFLGR